LRNQRERRPCMHVLDNIPLQCKPVGLHTPIVAATATTCIVALGFGIFAGFAPEGFWEDSGLELMKEFAYCEGARKRNPVKTPMNSWSNLIYATAGGWALGCAVLELGSASALQKNHQRSPSGRLPVVLTISVGVSSVLLSLGSFIYHASKSRWGNQMDVSAMYWLMNACLLSAAWRWACRWCRDMLWLRKQIFLALLVSVLIIVDALMYVYEFKLNVFIVFSVGMITIVLMELLLACRAAGQMGWHLFTKLVLGVVITLVGLMFRNFGVSAKTRRRKGGLESGGWFCSPKGIFQPHAIWHLFTGIGLLVLTDVQCRAPAWRPDANLESTNHRTCAELQASIYGVRSVELPS